MQIQNVDGQIKFIGKNELNDLSIVVVELNDNLEPINIQPIEFDEDYDDSNVAFTSDGGFLVSFYDFTLNNPTTVNVKKLQSDGQVIWSQDVSGFRSGGIRPIPLDDGSFYLGANHEVAYYDSDGVELNRKSFDPLGYVDGVENFWISFHTLAHEKGLIMIGNLQYPGGGPMLPIQTFIARTDSLGNTYTNLIEGKVFYDETEDCQLTNDELGLTGWVLELSRAGEDTMYLVTDTDGAFEILVDTGLYQLQYYPIDDYWTPCEIIYNIDFSDYNQTFTGDFPMQALYDCSFLTVDVATTALLAATQSTYYINYCNLGTALVDDPSIVLEIDPYMIVDSFSIQPASQDGNSYTFLLDELDYLECGNFKAYVRLDTDSIVVGQTHCMQAQIFPDTLCDIDPSWSGASVELSASCEGDSVVFTIKNVGNGTMIAPRDYFVVEDHVILSIGDFELEAGDMEMVKVEADGSTYWMQALQEPGHPGQSNPNVWIEGCGADNEDDFVTGMATQFPEDDGNPSISIDCRENLASYDPNDKQVFPRGIDEEHYTEPGTMLEYQIRFQNTGTAPAFEVNIVDTLSSFLNPATVRPGVSSHPYEFRLMEDGALLFRFKDIVLPDSASNWEESQGFVKFKVDMREDVPLESVIYNRAGIYFDFNPPIITNETWNTVGYYFITPASDFEEEEEIEQPINIYPNPFFERTTVSLPGLKDAAMIELVTTNGQLVYQQNILSDQFTLDVGHLAGGMYFYRIYTKERVLSAGKLSVMK
jgi:uncharacterized repeat protein (TIGR01451 family)